MELIHGDCLEEMDKLIEDGIKVDMILTDLPYGQTHNEWDKIIPPKEIWRRFNALIKNNGAMVITSSMRFATEMIDANEKYYRYDLVWYKPLGTGFLNCNRMPMRNHELILVFYKMLPTYNPIMTKGRMREKGRKNNSQSDNYGSYSSVSTKVNDLYYPQSVINVSNGDRTKESQHPTQKPVKLMEYLIETYTNEGDLVLDCCMGSGTTGVACRLLNRDFVGIEINQKYFDIAKNRICTECSLRRT